MRRARALAGAHAGYLIATGLWPLAHRPSFERVTRPKHDFWLVRTVGGLALLCGVTLGISALRGRRSLEVQTLAAGSALVFGVADVYAGRNVSLVYFGDLVPQLVFTPAWFMRWRDG